MPASRETTFHYSADADKDMLSIKAEGDLERRRSVYFTDQSPTFTIHVTNVSDGTISGRVLARVEFDESDDDYGPEVAKIGVELDPGESASGVLEPDIMSYQGHAAIRIDQGTVRDSDEDTDYRITKRSGNRRDRIYTFMVYDRDYYRVNSLWPRYSQYLAAFLSVLIVLVGIIQIATA